VETLRSRAWRLGAPWCGLCTSPRFRAPRTSSPDLRHSASPSSAAQSPRRRPWISPWRSLFASGRPGAPQCLVRVAPPLAASCVAAGLTPPPALALHQGRRIPNRRSRSFRGRVKPTHAGPPEGPDPPANLSRRILIQRIRFAPSF
jgi:hypothetical protein